MQITITLTEAQEYGIGLYADANGYKNEDGTNDIQTAIEQLVDKSSGMLIDEKYKKEQLQKTPEEMMQELSAA